MEMICPSPGTLHTEPSVPTSRLEDNSGIGCFWQELSRLAWKPRHWGTSSKSCSSLTPQPLGLQPFRVSHSDFSNVCLTHSLPVSVCFPQLRFFFFKKGLLSSLKEWKYIWIALQTQTSCLWRKKNDCKHVIRSSCLVKDQELKKY